MVSKELAERRVDEDLITLRHAIGGSGAMQHKLINDCCTLQLLWTALADVLLVFQKFFAARHCIRR